MISSGVIFLYTCLTASVIIFLTFQSNGEVPEAIHQTCQARLPGNQLFSSLRLVLSCALEAVPQAGVKCTHAKLTCSAPKKDRNMPSSASSVTSQIKIRLPCARCVVLLTAMLRTPTCWHARDKRTGPAYSSTNKRCARDLR